jgi:phosphatidylserine decarboxylase
MRRSTIGLCLEGVPYIGMAVLVTLFFALVKWSLPGLAALIVTLGIVHFFRDPERVVPKQEGTAVSPADGKVLEVRSRPEPVSGESRARISIFMNVFNVHVNRSPVPGTVKAVRYRHGRFHRASLGKADRANERNVIHIHDDEGQSWSMVQIAGLIARRIVCWVEVEDELECGQRVGLIKFGSRVDLYLPEGYEVKVRPGDTVYAGQSILARKAEQRPIHV